MSVDLGWMPEQIAELKTQRDDLLAALEELEKWTEAYSVSSGVTIEEEAEHFNPEFYAAMLQARAAIAKAKTERASPGPLPQLP